MDDETIGTFSKVIWKYKLPAAAVIAVLYGGKKLKDYMAGEEEQQGNTTINNYYNNQPEPATEDGFDAEGQHGKALMQLYKDNEHNNYHSENNLLLAKAFGTPKEVNMVELIIKKNQNFYHQLQRDLASLGPDLVFGFNKIPNLDLYFAGDTCYVNSNKQKNFLYKLTPRFKQFSFFEKEVFAQNKKTKILLLNKKQKNIFYEEYKTEESRLNIVPPGLSDDWIDKESSLDLREELGIKKSSKLLLFVGSDFSRKGLDRLIIAFASLDIENGDFYLLIAGDDNLSLIHI